MKKFSKSMICASSVALLSFGNVCAETTVSTINDGELLSWTTDETWSSATLTVDGEAIFPLVNTYTTGQSINLEVLAQSDQVLPDGDYTWSLVVYTGEQLSRGAGEANSGSSANYSGSFKVVGGAVSFPIAHTGSFDNDSGMLPRDVIHVDDTIIQGSLAAGFDSVNGESFGFDTIRLKENNLRIHFQDTSTSASFPSADWRIVANDSSNGGANYLAFEDSDAGTKPFYVAQGAGNNALYVKSGGNVGFGTSTPIVDLHTATGNTPTLRLEQNGTSGFASQTWDMAGNEANFFIRDVTNGSKLSFRIRPGAPESSIDIHGDGDVGMGTSSPQAALHVRRTNAVASILAESTDANGASVKAENSSNGTATISAVNSGTGSATVLAEVVGAGQNAVISAKSSAETWSLTSKSDGSLTISSALLGDRLSFGQYSGSTFTGNITCQALTELSDETQKTNFVKLDQQEVLEKVLKLPVSEWTYKNDRSQARHIGPMAQGFKAQFDLGDSDTRISSRDMAGVALAAIQGLNQTVEEKDAEIDALKEKSDRMEAQLQALMKEVEALKAN
ncbi:tail fiber domain-containing protein [Persicirhabdus sediminis]|uniref:Tail fiber domain-containing protein n=1 Tax=Persicirhabdus sediminis TaxID=454144 RepID=A0A8J7SJR1_9BACT|nr:tail fiber domain-containing protein [Persicirhabdus sediminis]